MADNRVVCIRDDWQNALCVWALNFGGLLPVRGRHYHVRATDGGCGSCGPRVSLVEEPMRCHYPADWFAEVCEGDAELEVLRRIARSPGDVDREEVTRRVLPEYVP